MIFGEPMAFDEAIAFAASKELLPTTLSSRQLAELSGEVKRRAVFSARVANAEYLQKLSRLVEKIAGGITEGGVVAGTQTGTDRQISVPEAKAQLKEYLDSIEYRPEPGDEGTIKDLSSDKRLQLQVETNVLDTLGYGRLKATQDEVALDVNPAWELVRMSEPKMPRDWEARWTLARGSLGSDAEGSTDVGETGRMVALKNHPIWAALGSSEIFDDALGNAWPPFAFNSGMNVVDVPRDEAVSLGLLGETTTVPAVDVAGLNEELSVDASRFDEALARALAENPDLEMRDGVLTLKERRAA